MRKHLTFPVPLLVVPAAAMAHHGWGSYDASKTVAVEGPIQASAYSNPHATITVKGVDKVWTVTLAPVSRMRAWGDRGAGGGRQDSEGRGIRLQGRSQ